MIKNKKKKDVLEENIVEQNNEKSGQNIKVVLPWVLLIITLAASAIGIFFLMNSYMSAMNTHNSKIQVLNTNIETLKSEVEKYKKESLDYQTKYSKSDSRVKELEKVLFCEDRALFKPDYFNSHSMSVALQRYVGIISGEELNVRAGTWDIIYSNSRLAKQKIFAVNKEGKYYAYDFLAYFDDDFYKNAVFSIGDQCWLDYPKAEN